MVPLINKDDNLVMNRSNFLKNAIFFKDMLAFYNAYENIMNQNPEELPNYCYHKGKYYLEGICLFISNYSSEFEFESLKLTLDYLKVIYYTLAGYSQDGNMPEKSLIEAEILEYQKACDVSIEVTSKNIEQKTQELEEKQNKFNKVTDGYAKQLILTNIYNVLSIFFLIAGLMVGMLFFSFYHTGILSLNSAFIIAVISVVVGLSLHILFKHLTNKYRESSNDTAYSIQSKKSTKDDTTSQLNTLKNSYNQVLCEKYYYSKSTFESLLPYRTVLSFSEILVRAKEYKLLSYNYEKDIVDIFENQTKEVKSIIKDIEKFNANTQISTISEKYAEIAEKDFLYYNNHIRFAFLNKFIETAEKSLDWKIPYNGKLVNPFDVAVKKLAHEQVVYLKDKDDLFVTAPLNKLLSTKYIKNLNGFKLKNLNTIENIKAAKVEFSEHFYDYQKTSKYDNLFYDKKIQDGVKIPEEVLTQDNKIPTIMAVRLKLAESKINADNCNAQTISQIAEVILKYEINIGKEVYYNKELKTNKLASDYNNFVLDDFNNTLDYSFVISDGAVEFRAYNLSFIEV